MGHWNVGGISKDLVIDHEGYLSDRPCFTGVSVRDEGQSYCNLSTMRTGDNWGLIEDQMLQFAVKFYLSWLKIIRC